MLLIMFEVSLNCPAGPSVQMAGVAGRVGGWLAGWLVGWLAGWLVGKWVNHVLVALTTL